MTRDSIRNFCDVLQQKSFSQNSPSPSHSNGCCTYDVEKLIFSEYIQKTANLSHARMGRPFKNSLMVSSAAMKAIGGSVKIISNSKWVRIDGGGGQSTQRHIY